VFFVVKSLRLRVSAVNPEVELVEKAEVEEIVAGNTFALSAPIDSKRKMET
jgi:hypothetical protein